MSLPCSVQNMSESGGHRGIHFVVDRLHRGSGLPSPLRARNRSDYEDINSVQDPISGNIIAGEYYRAGSNNGTVA